MLKISRQRMTSNTVVRTLWMKAMLTVPMTPEIIFRLAVATSYLCGVYALLVPVTMYKYSATNYSATNSEYVYEK
jgi:hypothetical protein